MGEYEPIGSVFAKPMTRIEFVKLCKRKLYKSSNPLDEGMIIQYTIGNVVVYTTWMQLKHFNKLFMKTR